MDGSAVDLSPNVADIPKQHGMLNMDQYVEKTMECLKGQVLRQLHCYPKLSNVGRGGLIFRKLDLL